MICAVVAAVEPFDLPHVRLDAEGLDLANGVDHQARPHFEIVALLAAGCGQLLGLGGHQHLEHEQPVVRVQVVGESLEPGQLPRLPFSSPSGL